MIKTVSEIEPIASRTDGAEVALSVYAQLFDLLEDLSPDEWAAPTECAGWQVSDMVRHLTPCRSPTTPGSTRGNCSGRCAPRHRVPSRPGCARRTAPGHHCPAGGGGSTATGMPRSVNLGHLADVIYTRDVWMHTIDVTRATGRTVNVTNRVNRRVVGDVVAEWGSRHGQTVDLILTGPAGGRYGTGDAPGRDPIEYDAVEFCRVLSGRAAGEGLVATRVLF